MLGWLGRAILRDVRACTGRTEVIAANVNMSAKELFNVKVDL